MQDTLPDKPPTPDARGAADLRSLRQLINSPAQQAIDELRRSVHRLYGETHTPEELTKLLVPVITDVLQKKILANENDVVAALAPIIDKLLLARTEQDKTAIVNALAPSVGKALRVQYGNFPQEVAEDLAPLMDAAIRENIRVQRGAMADALAPIIGAAIAKRVSEASRALFERINEKIVPFDRFKKKNRSALATLLPSVLLLALLIGIPLGWHSYRKSQNLKTEQAISEAISSSLGLSTNPIAVRVDGDDVELRGTLPNELFRRRVLDNTKTISSTSTIHTSILIAESSIHPALAASEMQRVASAFNTLQGVNISPSYDNGVLTLSGTVNDASLTQTIVAAFERLPGVSSVTYSFNKGKAVIQDIIYFTNGGSELSQTERAKLDVVKSVLASYPQIRLRIIGHSDSNGSKAHNIPITLGRAAAVKAALIRMGISENRLVVEGNGEPAPNLDPRLPENRCVRFAILEPTDESNK